MSWSYWTETPIPLIKGVEGREAVSIEECGEPLVLITETTCRRLRFIPAYFLLGYRAASEGCYVRESVSRMLRNAGESLPPGTNLVVLDGWRSVELQREIFERHYATVRRMHPDWTDDKVRDATKLYVSIPTDTARSPSPHLTGGAVDVTLCDDSGREMDMGTPFDFFGPRARTRFYEEVAENSSDDSVDQHSPRRNRRLIYHAMFHAGFTNYREEWWHYDFGDQFWGLLMERVAVYGGVSHPGEAFA